MPQGFFHGSELLSSKPPSLTVPQCGACQLLRKCRSPKMEPAGRGKRGILVVGMAPGRQEDKQGESFVGPSGYHLATAFRKFGVDLRKDCWLTNALICHPINKKGVHDKFDSKGDAAKKVGYCRPNLLNTIKRLNPETIILLGGEAVQSLIGWLWRENPGKVTRWVGWNIPDQTLNAWICPTWHPSFVLRRDYGSGRHNEVVQGLWEMQLEKALAHKGRPWDKVPGYEKQVELITDPKQAAKIIRSIASGDTIAFDYETDRLKPDDFNSSIVCCSVCINGKRTIAFPWMRQTIDAMATVLWNKRIKKIASNLKFENRWTQAKLGHKVCGWRWDTMVGAHVCDNRQDITSIKFQAFVRLGVKSYDDHIKPFLKADKGNKVNRIREVDFKQLLLYCGLDSLLEYHVAMDQMRYLGYGS